MNPSALKPLIHLVFLGTSRSRASNQAERQGQFYLNRWEALSERQGRTPVHVPLMTGVDEDMQEWSFFQLLEHNTFVNRAITAVTCQLARGEKLHGPALMNPKTDVLPGPESGPEQVDLFNASIQDHVKEIRSLDAMRRSATHPHPLFGAFTAHKWHCMFSVHLRIHNQQALRIADGVKTT